MWWITTMPPRGPSPSGRARYASTSSPSWPLIVTVSAHRESLMPESYHCLIADISGTRTLGPSDARLTVNTGKTGAASKAGHNLLIEVSSWSATLVLGENDA